MQKRLFLTPLAVIVFILYFTVFGDRGLLRINHLHRDRDEMQKRLLEMKGENDKLKREVAALQSDRRYLESIARRDFGLVRSNEVIYQFPSQEKAPTAQGGSPKKVEQRKGAQASGQTAGEPGGETAVEKGGQPAGAAGHAAAEKGDQHPVAKKR